MRERGRGTLQGRALHIMVYAADAAHFFASTGTTGAAVYEVRERRTVSGRLGRALAVDDHHATVHAGRSEYQCFGKTVVVRKDGTDQAAFTHPGKFGRFVGIGIRHQRADRTEGFHLVRLAVAEGFVAQQQHARHERSALAVGADDVHRIQVTIYDFAGAEQLFHFRFHIGHLAFVSQRSHADAFHGRISDHRILQLVGYGGGDGLRQMLRYDGAADGRAFCPALMVISRLSSRTKRLNSSVPGSASGPRMDSSTNPLPC